MLYKFLSGHMLVFLGVELWGHIVTTVNLLRNCQTVFQSDCTIVYSHLQCMRVSVFPHPHHTSVTCLFGSSHLGVKLCLIVVLTCVSLMANDVVYLSCVYWLFIYLLWRKVCRRLLFISICPVHPFVLSCENSLCILNASPLSDIWFANIFCNFVGCLLLS